MSIKVTHATHPLLRRWRLLLQIEGLHVRYYSGQSSPPVGFIDPSRAPHAGPYVDRPAIVEARPLGATLELIDGAVRNAGMDLVLATHGADGDRYDAGRVLGSLGTAGATWWGLVTRRVASEWNTPDLYVDRDPTGLDFPRRFHLGDETMWVTGAAGDGSDDDPWRLTGVVRGIAGTIPREHQVNVETGDQPPITSDEIISWDGRRYILYVSQTTETGEWMGEPEVELCRGVIDGQPHLEGATVTLRLLSPAAALDTKLTTQSSTTGLRQGWHLWSDDVATIVEHLQVWPEGRAWQATTTAVSGFGAQALNAPTAPYDALFDVELPEGHPRHGRLSIGAGAMRVQPQEDGHLANKFALPAGHPLGEVAAGAVVTNDAAAEVKALRLADTSAGPVVAEWPRVLFDAVNSETGWRPAGEAARGSGAHLGPHGAWLDVMLQETDEGYELVISHNCETSVPGAVAQVYLYDDLNGTPWIAVERWIYDEDAETWEQERYSLPPERCWFAFDLADPDDDAAPYPEHSTSRSVRWPARRIDIETRLRYLRVRIRGIARAWYQTGERYLFVRDRIDVPLDFRLGLRIEYYDRGAGEVRTHYTRVIGSTEILHPVTGVSLGWALELSPAEADRMPSFGDWPGRAPTRITPVLEWFASPDWRVILQLLLSTAGQGVSSPSHDEMPGGGGLGGAGTPGGDRIVDIDEESVIRLSSPREAGLWTLRHEDGDTIGDVLRPLLLATGSALVLRRSRAGQARLARVKLRPPNKVEAVGHLDVFGVDRPPASASDVAIRNAWRIDAAFDDEGEAQLQLTVRDQASIRLHGGYAREQQLSLRGLALPQDPEDVALMLLPLYARLFQMHGGPRRTWRVVVPTADALLLDVGSVVLVTSDYLWGDDARQGPGVVQVPALVVHTSMSLDEEGTELLLVSYTARGSGWNACCQVTAVSGPRTLTVARNRFRSTPHPRTGLDIQDLDYFVEGDWIQLVPRANHDAAVLCQIADIDRATREVTVSVDHPFGELLGYIYPPPYDTPASPRHKGLAYLAGDDGTLGAAGVRGDDFT